jgi:hypothetical protein
MNQDLENPLLWGIIAFAVGFAMLVFGINHKFEMTGLRFRGILTGIIGIVMGSVLIVSSVL